MVKHDKIISLSKLLSWLHPCNCSLGSWRIGCLYTRNLWQLMSVVASLQLIISQLMFKLGFLHLLLSFILPLLLFILIIVLPGFDYKSLGYKFNYHLLTFSFRFCQYAFLFPENLLTIWLLYFWMQAGAS